MKALLELWNRRKLSDELLEWIGVGRNEQTHGGWMGKRMGSGGDGDKDEVVTKWLSE